MSEAVGTEASAWLNVVFRFLPVEPDGTESACETLQLTIDSGSRQEGAAATRGCRFGRVVGRMPWLSSAEVEVCPGNRKGDFLDAVEPTRSTLCCPWRIESSLLTRLSAPNSGSEGGATVNVSETPKF